MAQKKPEKKPIEKKAFDNKVTVIVAITKNA